MNYREFSPSSRLAGYIECFWSVETTVESPIIPHRVLPDGCIDIIFDIGSNQLNKLAPKVPYVVGAMTKPLITEIKPQSHIIGIRFRPLGAYRFFRRPVHEIADLHVALKDFAHNTFQEIERFFEFRTLQGQINFLIQFFESLLCSTAKPKAIIRKAVESISLSHGQVRIEELSLELNISRQYLTRIFTHEVGISPKVFSRVMRLKSTNNILTSNSENPDFAELAIDRGYFDQAHLIAEYQSLVGLTPIEYQRSLLEGAL